MVEIVKKPLYLSRIAPLCLQGSDLLNIAQDPIDANLHSANRKDVCILLNFSQRHLQAKPDQWHASHGAPSHPGQASWFGMQDEAKTVQTILPDSLKVRV